jgi:hypothetical protein
MLLRSVRFQGQPLYKLRPSKFRAAIEEAFLAERGFFDLETDGVCSPRKSVNKQSDPIGFQEEAASNNEQECQSESQVTEYDEIVQLCVKLLPLIHLFHWLQCNSLNCRLLANRHCVVIAVVIVYHPRFQRKGSKRVSRCFVCTVKRYVVNLFSCGILHLWCSFQTLSSF